MNFLRTELILVSKDEIGDSLHGTRCINCHGQDLALIKIEWFLLCEKCLKKFIDLIRNKKNHL
jgi:hypothetical protein